MIYEVYPDTWCQTYKHICIGQRPAWSYLDGDAQDMFGYDIFTCNVDMITKMSNLNIGEEFECYIIEPGTGKKIKAIAMESSLLSSWSYREDTPQVYVFLKSDKESIRQRRKQMINRIISHRLNN